MAAGELEQEDSGWAKIKSTPGIYVFSQRSDGFYEVVVDKSYISWLRQHNFRFLDKAKFECVFRYDPTQPTEAEFKVYGIHEARKKSHNRFLYNAFKAIWSRWSRGLELCLRSIAPSHLQTALEWAILDRDILVSLFLILYEQ